MSLNEIRKDIDAIDNELKELFLRRMELSGKVADIKAEDGGSIYVPERENDIINRLTKGVGEEYVREYRAFIKRILTLSRECQYEELMKRKDCFPFDEKLIAQKSHNRIKVRFVCQNKCGELESVASVIADYGINITDIHMRYEDDELVLFLELEANMLKSDIKALLYQLHSETNDFQIIESYEVLEA